MGVRRIRRDSGGFKAGRAYGMGLVWDSGAERWLKVSGDNSG